ncbi:dynein light chain, flagellar outer arm [Elysia marginata]|uniref:Dynein light chain, flagellar outer arm n=1 Tax=Elysia marginata TaxID=1093978 RepID=A0AAV4J744_9GAST|nr:dynein light chain, flagellar outer arm [Elysia marginata]
MVLTRPAHQDTSEEQSQEVVKEKEEEEAQEEQNGADEGEEASKEDDVIQENGVAGEDNEETTEETAEEKAPCQMSEEHKEKCRKIFEKKANGGRLDLKGFKVLFRLMGEVLSTADADTMFQDGSKDDNGTIDFAEFCRLYMKFSQAEQERKDTVANSIEKLFPTSDGQPVELKKVESLLMKLQQPDLSMRLVREKSDLGQDDVRRLVKAMDKQGNGLISKNGG